MTKHEIIDLLCIKSGIKRKKVLLIVDNLFDIIIQNVQNNEKVELRGFGRFYKTLRKSREIYSPFAGKKLIIPEKAVLSFKPSKMLDEKIS